ncbi:MAG: ATPase, T2SS/T4P/T4SS family [bacterium]|nr:ATPase, T2SS/T4P/T4SS family [bacterium]
MNQRTGEVVGPWLRRLAQELSGGIAEREAVIEQAVLAARQKGSSLREALDKAGLVKERDYQRGLARLLDLEYADPLPEPESVALARFTELVGIRFAKAHLCYPLRLGPESVTLAVADPWPRGPFEEVARALGLRRLKLAIARPHEITAAINRSFDKGQSSAEEAAEVLEGDQDLDYLKEWGAEETEDLLDAEDEEPIKRLMNSILFQAVKDQSSDVHIDPGFKDSQVRYRIDGLLRPLAKVPRAGHVPLVNRVKVMAGLDISTKNKPQDGRSMILLAGKRIDIRVSIIPTVHGEQAVLRLLNQSLGILSLDQLGFSPAMAETLERMVQRPHGILLVTGPTGSGKTTTLYSLLAKIDAQQKNIVTIEDPVEYRIGDYGQMQVNEKTGVTFAKGLRSMLRQDPDVIMVGEMRDAETAQIGIQASLTGHLVLSTLHTNDAPSSIIRMIDMGIEPFLVSSTLTAVISQRLVRKICPHCKEEQSITPAELRRAGIKERFLQNFCGHIWRGRGCDACQSNGYTGRLGVYELLVIDEPVRRAISRGEDSGEIRKLAVQAGMLELSDDCALKVLGGTTSLEEMLRVVADPDA